MVLAPKPQPTHMHLISSYLSNGIIFLMLLLKKIHFLCDYKSKTLFKLTESMAISSEENLNSQLKPMTF